MNSKCTPQDDIDCYYNNAWKKSQELSDENPEVNNFSILQGEIDNDFYQFIIRAKKNDYVSDQLVKFRESYYSRSNQSKLIIHLTDSIKNIKTIKDLANMIRILNRFKIFTFFAIDVVKHFREPDQYVIAIWETSLVFEQDDFPEKIGSYTSFLDSIYKLISMWGYDIRNKDDFIYNIFVFEKLWSKNRLSLIEMRDPSVIYNSMKYSKFLKIFDTQHFLESILNGYVQEDMYIMYDNEKIILFIKRLIDKMNPEYMAMIKDYLVFVLAKSVGIFTDIADSFNHILVVPINQQQMFVELFYETFGSYLEKKYEKIYRNEEKDKQVRQMFMDIKSYCIDIFKSSEIFSPDTQNEALKKLHTLDLLIGVQDCFVDLNLMPILTNNFFDDLLKINQFYFDHMISMVGKIPSGYCLSFANDVYSFFVNAYYDPHLNTIYIPTSLVNDFFFKVNTDPIYNFGSLGSIIGHEIMHCFDAYGAQFDHLGHLRNWWTKEDYIKFNQEIDKINKHYSMFRVNGMRINTDLTISENMADISGLKISLRTYLRKYMPNIKDKLTGEQKKHLEKFFKRWAETLRALEDDKILEYSIRYDEHLPSTIRINAPFSHLKEYYEIFNVKPKNKNYLDPNMRIRFLEP